MNKTALISLMSQAPIKPNWFEGKDLPVAPKEPSREVKGLSFSIDVKRLVNNWLVDPIFDLWSTDLRDYDFVRGIMSRKSARALLKEFAEMWETYWTIKAKWTRNVKVMQDIQWRIYWAKEALKEIEKESNDLD